MILKCAELKGLEYFQRIPHFVKREETPNLLRVPMSDIRTIEAITTLVWINKANRSGETVFESVIIEEHKFHFKVFYKFVGWNLTAIFKQKQIRNSWAANICFLVWCH